MNQLPYEEAYYPRTQDLPVLLLVLQASVSRVILILFLCYFMKIQTCISTRLLFLEAFYKMSDPRPVSCLLRSGTKRCSGEEIVFFFHQTSPPPTFSAINLVKRLELEDCLLLLAPAPIPGYVLSNPWEKTSSHFFCTPALQLGFFSPLVGLYQIPVIFARKEGNDLSWRASCPSKYRVSGKTAT